jgi:hypothetical protein
MTGTNNRFLAAAPLAVVLGLLSTALCEASHITLGAAAPFALLGTDVKVNESVTGPSTIIGNVGVGPGAKFSISGSSDVFGDIIFYDTITGSNFSNSSSGVVPAPYKDTATVTLGINAALAASNAISAAVATQSLSSISGTTTINRTSADNVIRLSGSISLGGGDVLTINGLPNDYFYFDLPIGNFGMNGGSQIVLTGGVTQNHVYFNVTSSGGQVAFSNTTTTAIGNFLVTQRSVQVNAPTLYGRIYSGGGQISVTSGGSVIRPEDDTNIPEPSTAVLMSLGAAAFAACGIIKKKRRLRQQIAS